jgi:hypothetical protein
MDRLKMETGADPMPDPIAQLPADEAPSATDDDQALAAERAVPGESPPDSEDDLIAGVEPG